MPLSLLSLSLSLSLLSLSSPKFVTSLQNRALYAVVPQGMILAHGYNVSLLHFTSTKFYVKILNIVHFTDYENLQIPCNGWVHR